VALVAAGVALGRLTTLAKQFKNFHAAAADAPTATFQVPMNRAYALWKGKGQANFAAAEALLTPVKGQCAFAVPFAREYALILATGNQLPQARAILEGLVDPAVPENERLTALAEECCHFGDFETLCRIGRIYKDRADQDWQQQWKDTGLRFADLGNSSARQAYRTAHLYYRMALKISDNFYPGENAAITAWLADWPAEAKDIAGRVLRICEHVPLTSKPPDIWLYCTEGTLTLLTDKPARADEFFSQALRVYRENGEPGGFLNPAYITLCRLYEALEDRRSQVLAIVKSLRQAGVQPQPAALTDCGSAVRA
jgi:hypothetical protein